MVTMVAVVPQPPLMVPQLCTGRAGETEPMRSAALTVVGRMARHADRWVVVGADPGGRRGVDAAALGTFGGYGVDVRVSLAPSTGGPLTADLPLPVLIAGWLRTQAGPDVRAHAELVPPDWDPEACRSLGAELAAAHPGRTGLLVVGDGAVLHTDQVAGYTDERAAPFDERVAGALRTAAPDELLALDPGLAAELGAVGRAPWQVLAGAALAEGDGWRGELAYTGAPYGVAYHVALWSR